MTKLTPCSVVFLGWMVAVAGTASGAAPFDPPPKIPTFGAAPGKPVVLPRAPVARRVAPPAAAFPIPRAMTPAPVMTGLPKNVQNLVDFYGSPTSYSALSQLQSRSTTGSTSSSTTGYSRPSLPRQVRKPFQNATSSPTISPYLNLFREENNTYLPNYHAFVRPEHQQQTRTRQQRGEMNRLQKQVRTVAFGSAVGAKTPQGAPATGHGTRYLNTAGYYPPSGTLR